MKTLGLALAATLATTAMGAAAHADTIKGLYSTGVDDAGALIPWGAGDTHWKVNDGATPVVYNNGNYIGASDAQFIAVQTDGGYTNPVNTYQLTFNLPTDFTSAQLSGVFEADNYASVYLNGTLIGHDLLGLSNSDPTNYQSETAFSTTTGFKGGENVLSFTVTDTGPPSSLEVSGLSGTVSAAPEPGVWALMLAGVAMIGATLRLVRRQRGLALA